MVAIGEKTRPRRGRPPGAFVTAAGVPIHYVTRGEGRPVVYIHGAKSSVYDFLLSIADTVSPRYRVVAFDRPGSGFSGRTHEAGGGSPQAQAAVLRAATAALGIDRPVLVGHSFGAAVALAWALDTPATVSAVVTLGGHVVPLGEAPPWVTSLARSRPALLALSVAGRLPVGRPLVDWTMRRIFYPDAVPSDYLRIAPSLALSPGRLVSDGEERRGWTVGLQDLEARYSKLEVPVVIVVGARDQVVPPRSSLRLHHLAPRSELVVLPETGHMPHFARPDVVLAAIDRAAELADEATVAADEP